jgi:hypothetical protein
VVAGALAVVVLAPLSAVASTVAAFLVAEGVALVGLAVVAHAARRQPRPS